MSFIRLETPCYAGTLTMTGEQVTDNFAIYPTWDFDDEHGQPEFLAEAWTIRHLPSGHDMLIGQNVDPDQPDSIGADSCPVDLDKVRCFLHWLETRADWSGIVHDRDLDATARRWMCEMRDNPNSWRNPDSWRAPEEGPATDPRGGVDRLIAAEVLAERARQDQRWGEQNHPDGTGPTWVLDRCGGLGGEFIGGAQGFADLMRACCQTAADRGMLTYRHILFEEIAEAFAEADPSRLRGELVQVAAVAQAWIAKLDRQHTDTFAAHCRPDDRPRGGSEAEVTAQTWNLLEGPAHEH